MYGEALLYIDKMINSLDSLETAHRMTGRTTRAVREAMEKNAALVVHSVDAAANLRRDYPSLKIKVWKPNSRTAYLPTDVWDPTAVYMKIRHGLKGGR